MGGYIPNDIMDTATALAKRLIVDFSDLVAMGDLFAKSAKNARFHNAKGPKKPELSSKCVAFQAVIYILLISDRRFLLISCLYQIAVFDTQRGLCSMERTQAKALSLI